MNLDRYKLVSSKNGGQYAGPCYFTGEGRDRFTLEPNSTEGKTKWFCRQCSLSCRYGRSSSGYRFGFLEQDIEFEKMKDVKGTEITYEKAREYTENLTNDGIRYLKSRGITKDTADYFKLGMMGDWFITIPLIYTLHGNLVCKSIKKRVLPKYHKRGMPKYLIVKGGIGKAIYNFDALRKPRLNGVIANSLFDVMILHQVGFQAVAPFAGEASWDEKWAKYIKWRTVINLGDNDENEAGQEYMLKRALQLEGAPNLERVVNLMPEEHSDINEMYVDGVDIEKWIKESVSTTPR